VLLVLAGCAATGTRCASTTLPTLAVIMLTLVLPFMAAFLHVFTGGDPQVFSNVADYTSQEMIVRLAIFVTVCVLASIGIGVGWFWRRAPTKMSRCPRTSTPIRRRWRRTGALLMGFSGWCRCSFFTTFLTNTVQGLASGVVGSLGYWVAQQGVKRGGQPIYYYALVGWLYEFLPAFLSTLRLLHVFYNLFRTDQQHNKVGPPTCSRAGDLPRLLICYTEPGLSPAATSTPA
jgi:hypothetical protein